MISGRREGILQLSVPQRKRRHENPQTMGCVLMQNPASMFIFNLLHIQLPEYVAQHSSFQIEISLGIYEHEMLQSWACGLS